jgi:hypothetical protein
MNVEPHRFASKLLPPAIVGGLLLMALTAAFDGACFLLDPDPRRQSESFGVFLIVISAIPWLAFLAWLSWLAAKPSRLLITSRWHPIVALVSLVLLVAVTLLWSRGWFYVDYLVDGSGPRRWLIVANHRILEIGRSRANGTLSGLQWMVIPAEKYPKYREWFFYFVGNPTGWVIGIPLWFCVIVLGGLSAISFRHRCIPSSGFCQKCGYDLRATPERCPECGTLASSAPVTPPIP